MIKESLHWWGNILGWTKPEVVYITDSLDWVLYWVGRQIGNALPGDYSFRIVTQTEPYRHRVLHFSSQFMYFIGEAYKAIHPSNRQVVTWFHGQPQDENPEMQALIRSVPEGSLYADKIVTACKVAEQNLLSWAVESTKVVRIPLGVDTRWFVPPSVVERQQVRVALNIPDTAVCIGSFQKDGVGWGDGNEPKLIKGPDIFLQVVARLSQNYPVFVLLTGPSRGFVRQGLEKLGVPYHHIYLENCQEVARYYKALDVYLITSRDEGGPKALLECMATGIPVVASRVGMCPDVLQEGRNGFLIDVGDVEGMTRTVQRLLANPSLRASVCDQALKDVQAYDWKHIANQYHRLVYDPLLQEIK